MPQSPSAHVCRKAPALKPIRRVSGIAQELGLSLIGIARIAAIRNDHGWVSGDEARLRVELLPTLPREPDRPVVSGTERAFRASEVAEPEDLMHAVVVDVTLEAEPTPESLSVLQNEVVAGVKASPGCIAGYWLEPVDGKGHSIVLFDTEEQARAAAPPLGAAPMPGVTIDSVEIRAVIATA